MTRRVVVARLVTGFALLGSGCSTAENLGSEPVGAMNRSPGLVYGGVRSDVVEFVNYPVGPGSLWCAVFTEHCGYHVFAVSRAEVQVLQTPLPG